MRTAMLLMIFTFGFPINSAQAEYFRAKFISFSEAKKPGGHQSFDIQEFKGSDSLRRAPMAVDAVKRQLFKGKDMNSVREELGDPGEYFFNDTILACRIQNWTEKKREAWQLIFVPDELQKVS